MTKIEAILRPERFSQVKTALDRAGYHGITALDVLGHGRQRGLSQVWRGKKYVTDMIPKVMLVLVVPDGKVGKVIAAITGAAKSGAIGDGKIFVSKVQDAVRVRTGERGQKAL